MRLTKLQNTVFLDRYALRDKDNNLLETKVEDMWKRVAAAVAKAEKSEKRSEYEEKFYDLLYDFKFVPGGRILKSAGAENELTYYNCFVVPSPNDSRHGIMKTGTDIVEIMSRGGGVGINLSTLRPRGAYVKGVNGTSSGPVSWAEVYSQIAGSVIQGGSRRGALMLMLNVDHPDIEEFITVKQDLSKLINANLSVGISDSFMDAVKRNKDWKLTFNGEVYKTVKAVDLWNLICRYAWECGEPGVVFLERYNQMNNTWYYEPIIGTNPCGEQGLPAWGVCNLGHINLTKFIKEHSSEYTPYNLVDWEKLRETTVYAVRFLDNVIDVTPYFFKENEEVQKKSRRIGLGTMGLADALIKLNLRYGSEEAINFVEKLYRKIAQYAYEASIKLAEEKGSFYAFNPAKYLMSNFIRRLPDYLHYDIRQYGIRNATLLTQAPTGTISVLANVSSGIEPNFAFEYKRKDRIGEYIVKHPLYEEWITNHPNEQLPDYFVTAQELTPEEHVKMQATIQKWVDSSISKTVNAPNSHTIEDVKKLYMMAYDMGCKGITYFRDGSREGVLTKLGDKKKQQTSCVPIKKPVLTDAPARRIKIKTGCGDMWITLVFDDNENLREIFTVTGHSGGCAAHTEALSRMVSCALRHDIPPREVVKQLTEIKPCRSFDRLKQKNSTIKAKSCPHAIALEISKYIKQTEQEQEIEQVKNVCPDCGQPLQMSEGCMVCQSCGFSKCN